MRTYKIVMPIRFSVDHSTAQVAYTVAAVDAEHACLEAAHKWVAEMRLGSMTDVLLEALLEVMSPVVLGAPTPALVGWSTGISQPAVS